MNSTMDEARLLAADGALSGTVICADCQLKGRGRFDRAWLTGNADSLLFTIILRYNTASELPGAFTLRTGLAVSTACDKFTAPFATSIKWPNDIYAENKKLCGILTESIIDSGRTAVIYTGIGVNVLQKDFDGVDNAVSILQLNSVNESVRFILLQEILYELYTELNDKTRIKNWRERLSKKLYLAGEKINFAPLGRGTEEVISCTIKGIDEHGALIVETENGEKNFISGEIRLAK